jgi:2-isopropylmalate synthase
MSEKLIIFDTTLRDGEQCPGAAMHPEEKLAIAKMLDRAGVDIIEAGFASSSQVDSEAISLIARNIQNARVCSLSRSIESDIIASANAVKHCRQGGRIHVFLATSPIHREFKLKKSKEQILEIIESSVKFARNLCGDVEWSAEDATRTELDFLAKCVEVAIKSGARTINLPDTVGFATPRHIQEMVQYIQRNSSGIEKAIISMHGQNDLGLATANTLAGVEVGARQVELTINGIGERAGNTSFEEVIMAIKTRSDVFPNVDISHINTRLIKPLSDLVSNITGFVVQNNKAIVGANAFAHESGIHQDGMLKNRGTYEIIEPSTVGIEETKIVLGKHSGRNALKNSIEKLGFEVKNDDHLQEIFEKFKKLASSKKHITDADIVYLMKDLSQKQCIKGFKFIKLTYSNESGTTNATVSIEQNGMITTQTSIGNGTVDAIFIAIKELTKTDFNLDLYQVHAVTGGTDALGSATVRLQNHGKNYTGIASDVDVLKASAMAYIEAVNSYLTK